MAQHSELIKTLAKAGILSLMLLAVLAVVVHFGENMNVEFIRQQRAAMDAYYESHQWQTIALFTLASTLYIGVAIPAGQLLPIAAGLFFGYWLGVATSAVMYAVGPMITFLISRYCLGDALQKRFADRLQEFNRGFEKNGVWYLFIIRQLPLPFFAANLCMGLTSLKLGKYFWANLLSLSPNLFLAPYLGTLLTTVEDINDVFSPYILVGIALVVALPPLIAQMVASHLRKRKAQREAAR